MAGYNVQIAVDDKCKLIVASEVITDGNDSGQLHAMAQAAKAALEAQALRVVADAGYCNGEMLRACEADGIEAFVPQPQRGRQAEEGRFGLDAFGYDAEADAYGCPGGQTLRPMPGRKTDATGKVRIRYTSRRSTCAACPLRERCLSAKGDRRVIERWEHEDVMERHRARMARGEATMRRRKALAEHPFGTLKCRAGYTHFLLRGLEKVRGECGLMVLCYNLTRVLNILGIETFVAWLAEWSLESAFALLCAVLDALNPLQANIKALALDLHRQQAQSASRLRPAT